MKENLNQLTEIYSKKPVKAGGKYNHSRVGSDSLERDNDEVVLLPEIRQDRLSVNNSQSPNGYGNTRSTS